MSFRKKIDDDAESEPEVGDCKPGKEKRTKVVLHNNMLVS